jgi:hypothetical protein
MIGFPQFASMALTGLNPIAIGGAAIGTGLLGKAAVDAVKKERQLEGKGLMSGSPGTTLDEIIALSRNQAMLAPEVARQLSPVVNELENARLQRALQQNQQLGQITGALARQKYGFELAGGAQRVGLGALDRMMATPNPYAQSALAGMTSLSL